MSTEKTTTRTLHEIAREIRKVWANVHYSAKPYLDAMSQMGSVKENFMFDSGHDIVIRFLGNATTWRGEDARRIKAELKQMCK